MKSNSRSRRLTDEQIDEIVVARADDEAAWEKPIRVKRKPVAAVRLPAELAARAAFLSKLHREPKMENWIRRVVEERVELEEAVFAGLKRELATKFLPS